MSASSFVIGRRPPCVVTLEDPITSSRQENLPHTNGHSAAQELPAALALLMIAVGIACDANRPALAFASGHVYARTSRVPSPGRLE